MRDRELIHKEHRNFVNLRDELTLEVLLDIRDQSEKILHKLDNLNVDVHFG